MSLFDTSSTVTFQADGRTFYLDDTVAVALDETGTTAHVLLSQAGQTGREGEKRQWTDGQFVFDGSAKTAEDLAVFDLLNRAMTTRQTTNVPDGGPLRVRPNKREKWEGYRVYALEDSIKAHPNPPTIDASRAVGSSSARQFSLEDIRALNTNASGSFITMRMATAPGSSSKSNAPSTIMSHLKKGMDKTKRLLTPKGK